MKWLDQFLGIGLKKPKTVLIFCLAFLLLSLYGLKDFSSNFTARIWHKKDSVEILNLNQFERQFGGDEIFLLGIDYQKNIFNEEILNDIRSISESLWKLPLVLRVDSFANVNHIKYTEEEIDIKPLIPEEIIDTLEIEKNSDSIKEIQNTIINKDKNFILYSIKIIPSFGENPNYDPFIKALKQFLSEQKGLNKRYSFLGSVAVANAFKEISESDSKNLLPIMFILIILILGFYFRSFLGVMAPLIIIFFTLGESFGFLSFMGYEFNSILGAIPGVLLGICIADSIHILTSFYQQRNLGKDKKEAMKFSLQKNLIPTLLTTITTALSFLSISYTELVPINHLGIVAFYGTLLAWINSYLLIPSLMMILTKSSSPSKMKSFLRLDPTNFILKNNRKIISITFLLSCLCGYLCFFNEANSDPLQYFSPKTKIRKDFEYAEGFFETVRSVNIVIDSGEIDGAKDPTFLKKVESFNNEVENLPYVTKVRSVLDIIKSLNKNLTDQRPESEVIPPTKSHVAEYLLLYSLGTDSGLGLDNRISNDNRFLNIQVNWIVKDTNDSLKKNQEILSIARQNGLNAHAGGTFSVYAGVNDKVVKSFFESLLLAIFSVSVVVFCVFRNFFYAFLAMLPNFVPLLFVGAYTALTKTYIDVGSSIVFAICLGIAIDDTIHFMIHYINNYKELGDVKKSLQKTFSSSGEAILLTTFVLVVGFGSFIFADFLPNQKFGVLSSMVLIIALVTDLLFLPAILSFVKSKKE